MSNIQTINFNNQQLLTVEKDGIKYVAVKPICENLGLDWSSQRTKIKDNHILGSVMVIITTTGSDNKNYEMSCLPIDYINGWLFTINPNKVSEEIRPLVIYYQKECHRALFEFWNKPKEFALPQNYLEALKALMNKLLHDLKIQYKDKDGIWKVYAKYAAADYAKLHTTVLNPETPKETIVHHLKWTQKGRLFIYDLLKSEGVLPIVEKDTLILNP